MSVNRDELNQARADVSNIYTKAIQGSNSDIDGPAKELSDLIAGSSLPSEWIHISILVLHSRAMEHPTSLDHLLKIYSAACELFPESVENSKGTGKDAGQLDLHWTLIEESQRFQGLVQPDIGEADTEDASNINFREEDLKERTTDVLTKIDNWRADRQDLLVWMATQARSYSLGAVELNNVGSRASALSAIQFGLDRAGVVKKSSRPWSKADFLAACVLIRGCARSLKEAFDAAGQGDVVVDWVNQFGLFIQSDNQASNGRNTDNDFVLKSNAALVLLNFAKGPIDETSEQLFDSRRWIY
ncbi:MAG: hypothetical protein M1812_004437 [Candelaria pacifica]|nr:MAG: hypothetical protein M1812_004437 [Candelaria pacifica]